MRCDLAGNAGGAIVSTHTTNHRYEHDAHERTMYTHLAPGPTIPRRRKRVPLWTALAFIAAISSLAFCMLISVVLFDPSGL